MANFMYGLGRNKFARGDLKWLAAGGDAWKCALIHTGYTPASDTDEFWNGISANLVGTPVALTPQDPTLGVCDASDITFSTVAATSQVKYLVIYKDTTTASTSPLIICIDTATGLPVTPNGGDITVQWDSGANRIFKL